MFLPSFTLYPRLVIFSRASIIVCCGSNNAEAGVISPIVSPCFNAGGFRLPAQPILVSERISDEIPLKQLERDIQQQFKFNCRIIFNAFGPATIRIRRTQIRKHPEGYRIAISREGIKISAENDAGAYYAIQTLRDLLILFGRQLPTCVIEDWPDFDRRGVYHDCSRGKVPTIETLKQLDEIKYLLKWS